MLLHRQTQTRTAHAESVRNTRIKLVRLSLFVSLFFMVTLVCAAPSATPKKPIDDIRVLIDISGSMKRTDPNNLRKPALKLFASLLPDGSRAGVWTFGQWVNMLIKSEKVDERWKKGARKAAGEINSLGLFTNIEDVIKRSTWDWKRPDPAYHRSLILLTDGLVDISKDSEKNAASRHRILDELLPQLQQAGVTIHTIALSQESDQNMLKQLSAATNGWFETIETADGLERLFLRMFEKVANTEKLPLIDNRVIIDSSINEATFLVFRKAGADETSITTPSGKTLNLKNKMDNTQWYNEDRYDLITIKNPEQGEWQINAASDPDNRVMVVTDLKLITTTLPSNLEALNTQIINVQLEQNGEIIKRKDFLRFVKVSLTQTAMDGQQWERKVRDNGRSGDRKRRDGIYTVKLGKSLLPGEHEIEILVDGKTFKRTARQLIRIVDIPADINLTADEEDVYTLSIVPFQDIINIDSMIVTAQYTQPSGETTELEIPRTGTTEWSDVIDARGKMGEHQLIFKITGNRQNGSMIDKTAEPMTFLVETQAQQVVENIAPPEPVIEPFPSPAPVQEPTPESEEKNTAKQDKSAPAVTDEQIEEEPIDWLMTSLRILLFNLFLGGLIFAGFKFWPRIKSKILPNPVEALENGK